MGDENVVSFDETSPFTQSHRNILSYQRRPEESTTFLIELPEVQIDAPRPSTQLSSRPRRSTIVDIQQASVSKEAELDPLQDYVRRNLSSLRRSIVPEDVPNLTRGWQSEEGELVYPNPATAEETERGLMESKTRNTRETAGSADTSKGRNKHEEHSYRRRHSSEERKEKRKDSNSTEWPSVMKVKKYNDSNTYEDSTKDMPDQIKSKPQKHGDRQPLMRNEVFVMPALEPVPVDQKSPFAKEEQELKNKSSSPIKIKLFVQPSEEETSSRNDKSGDRHHSKRDKSDRRYTEENKDNRKKSRDTSNIFLEEDMPTNNHKKRKSLRKSDDLSVHPGEDGEEWRLKNETSPRKVREESSSDGKRERRKSRDSRGRSSQDDKRLRRKPYDERSSGTSVCLSGTSDNNTSEPNIVNNRPKDESSSRKHRGERSLSIDGNKSPRSSDAKSRDPFHLVDHTKTEHPFGREESYAVHYAATEGKNKKVGKKAAGKKRDVDPNKEKFMTAKAPRSATKIVARRRYHIQIPEHGRVETWFNVRFNMNDENNVDMDYEGPVKINNYYVSNNYS